MSTTLNSNVIHFYFISLSFFVFAGSNNATASPTNGIRLRGMFIFGSSIVDNGNNNHLIGDFAKANYIPYGVDLPPGPTGRFSNGKNVADLIADHLNLPLAPPFSDPHTKGISIIRGVNFASGGSGILDVTGVLLGVTSMNNQVKRFKNNILPQLEDQFGRKAHKILPEYLFLVGAGNNDYSSYYLLHQNLLITPEVFAVKLIGILSAQLKGLYDLGARKFVLLSVYPVGCNPVLAKNKVNCVEELNAAVDLFHDQLLVMVKHKKDKHMPDAQFSVAHSAKIITRMLKNTNLTGFTNVDFTCCETTMGGLCQKQGKVCRKRNEYVYFDGLHLTEAASAILATKAYNSTDPNEVFPVNLQQLAQL